MFFIVIFGIGVVNSIITSLVLDQKDLVNIFYFVAS